VSTFSMLRAEDVVFQLPAEVGSAAVRELHRAPMCHARRVLSTRPAGAPAPCANRPIWHNRPS
jgi:hypothetical protein